MGDETGLRHDSHPDLICVKTFADGPHHYG